MGYSELMSPAACLVVAVAALRWIYAVVAGSSVVVAAAAAAVAGKNAVAEGTVAAPRQAPWIPTHSLDFAQ